MTGGVPSVQAADDAFAPELNSSPASQGNEIEAAFEAAASDRPFDQAQSKTHQMQALLARAVETGQFDGDANGHSTARQAAELQRVLLHLENAKTQLDRVRLRG